MQINPYIKTNWVDHIVDIEYGDVIQEGTRFTASRANNIEDGIYNMHGWMMAYYDELTKLRIQLEMVGRVPVNNGTFFDPIDEDGNMKALTLLKEVSVLQKVTKVGVTELTVEDGSMFKVGEEITILDEEKEEVKVISNVVDNKLTVSATINAYKKGALVLRSNVVIRNNKLGFDTWGNYTVEGVV